MHSQDTSEESETMFGVVRADQFYPDDDRIVLIYVNDFYGTAHWKDGYYDKDAGIFFCIDYTVMADEYFVTHWQEMLPAPD